MQAQQLADFKGWFPRQEVLWGCAAGHQTRHPSAGCPEHSPRCPKLRDTPASSPGQSGLDLTASPGVSLARIRSLDGRLIPFIPASLTPRPSFSFGFCGRDPGPPHRARSHTAHSGPQTPGFQPQSVSSKSLGPDLSPCLLLSRGVHLGATGRLLEPWGPPQGQGQVRAQKPTQSGVPTTSQGLKQHLKQTSLTRPRSPLILAAGFNLQEPGPRQVWLGDSSKAASRGLELTPPSELRAPSSKAVMLTALSHGAGKGKHLPQDSQVHSLHVRSFIPGHSLGTCC